MGAFFESLKAIEKVFFISAVLGGALFLVRLVLMFIGGDHGDSDAGGADIGGDVGGDAGGHMGGDMGGHDGSMDSHDGGDTDASFKAISLQSLTAFFMMFGLVGLALSRQSKFPESLSVFGAVIGGVLSVWLIGKTLASMRKLQSEGTLDIRNAIGQEGTVYLSIPANGKGVVQINVQDTLRELSAVSHDKTAIKTGERVIVEDITGGNILVVKTV
jgi:membrane protein implicated in regulation of membrane protease activity